METNKRSGRIMIVPVLLFSVLFYRQSAGVNFFVFSIAIVSALVYCNHDLLRSRSWLLSAVLTVLSGFLVMWYGNVLSVIANFISLTILAGISKDTRTSVITAFIYTWFSYWLSVVYMIIDLGSRHREHSSSSVRFRRIIWITAIPLVVTFIFITVYRMADPFFNEWVAKISISWISADRLMFTCFGFILLYGYFHQKRIGLINDYETQAPDQLVQKENKGFILAGKVLTSADENLSGIILFAALNVLLLFVNALDFNFLFVDHRLPAGITFSQFVHQGAGAVIISILLAIILILFYFRGDLNFYPSNKMIRFLAFFWIIQNMMMLISTAMRNDLYIDAFGLTYKRIGVYVYLFLAAVGLITTFIKIAYCKTNMYLFRVNGWAGYLVLIFSVIVNWDRMITEVNLSKKAYAQDEYIVDLGTTNLPQLLKYKATTYRSLSSDKSVFPSDRFINRLDKRLYSFLRNQEKYGWQSYCVDDVRVMREINLLDDHGMITSLDLGHLRHPELSVLKRFKNIRGLSLRHADLTDTDSLVIFPDLRQLDVSYNNRMSMEGLVRLKQLQQLNIAGNKIPDVNLLRQLPGLTELVVTEKGNEDQLQLIRDYLPQITIISVQ